MRFFTTKSFGSKKTLTNTFDRLFAPIKLLNQPLIGPTSSKQGGNLKLLPYYRRLKMPSVERSTQNLAIYTD